MDVMKIESRLMKNIISKAISAVIRKKLGYKIDIQINETLTVKIDDGVAHVHLNVDAKMDTDEFKKLTKSIEEEE